MYLHILSLNVKLTYLDICPGYIHVYILHVLCIGTLGNSGFLRFLGELVSFKKLGQLDLYKYILL